ncbi:MAG: hypothetical protein E6Q66_10105 [Pedobacter sp.]|jgi:hypothetical protein|nr:MAG: hypothetical protein E6Q66_10105 [Pedobacter sp.]
MAKKNFDKLEEGNKNLGGVNALFTTPKSTEKKKDIKEEKPKIERIYNLRIDDELFKNLELRRVQTRIPIKQQIIDAIKGFYNL